MRIRGAPAFAAGNRLRGPRIGFHACASVKPMVTAAAHIRVRQGLTRRFREREDGPMPALMLLAACASAPPTVVGRASVTDGDTLDIHDRRISS